MADVIDFSEILNAGSKKAGEEIRPLIDLLWEMDISNLLDFCHAVEKSMDYVIENRYFSRFFTDSTMLSSLIATNYIKIRRT